MNALLLAVLAYAAPVNPFEEPDESELFRLDEELVTVASRYAQTLRKAPSIVSLVSAQDIRKRGYLRLSDVLRDLPGIYVWRSQEGRDIATFRGVLSSDNNKVLLLVDGQPWYDGVYTHAFLDDYLPLSNVKQVEVIKGPGSAVYGTNAFSGVVNVVTWDGNEVDGLRARWVAGSHGRSDLTATVGGRDDVGGIPVTAVAYARLLGDIGDGLDQTPRANSSGEPAQRVDIQGQDPHRGLAVGARVQVAGLRLQIHHVDYAHSFLINEADSPYGALNKDIDNYGLYYHNTFFDARYRFKYREVYVTPHLWSQRHDNPGSYFFSRGYQTRLLPGGTFETVHQLTTVETEKDTRRWGSGVDLEGRPGIDHVTVGGLGFEASRILALYDREFDDFSHTGTVTGFNAPAGAGVTNLYGYAQHTWTALPALEVTGGLRLDMRLPPSGLPEEVEAPEPYSTPSLRVGVLWVPTDIFTAKLLYGGAFRAPSIRELLVAAPYEEDEHGDRIYEFASGNLALRPETIHTIEAEASADPLPQLEARVAVSYSVLSDEIDKVYDVIDPDGAAGPLPGEGNMYRNLVGGLGIVGAEIEATGKLEPFTATAAYALTLARYADVPGNPYRGLAQYEFPPHMLKGRAQIDLTENLSAVLLAEVYSARPRSTWSPNAGMQDGKAFGLLHLAIRAARLGKEDRVELSGTVRNLANTKWGTGVYRDDADAMSGGALKFPGEMEGVGRSVHVAIEVKL